jgi:hypothetical protein
VHQLFVQAVQNLARGNELTFFTAERSDTICDPQNVEALPALSVDEPTVSMFFNVNTSPSRPDR